MPVFRFQKTNSFDANWEAFLAEMDQHDSDMADILRANQDTLAAIVRQGDRDAQERARFNASVLEALNSLLAHGREEDQG